MDFLRIIRSVEELLYEVMTWLVFYPRTMWRIVARPETMTRYSDDEQGDQPAEQYTDTLSPPLLLMLTILIAHSLELGLGLGMPSMKNQLGSAVWGSAQNILVLRAVLFSLFALTSAQELLKRRRLPLDRKALRRPFFSQCYLAAPFCLMLSTGVAFGRMAQEKARLIGAVVAILGVVWYLWVETAWFRRLLGVGHGRALLVALGSFAKASLYTIVVALVLGVLTGGSAP